MRERKDHRGREGTVNVMLQDYFGFAQPVNFMHRLHGILMVKTLHLFPLMTLSIPDALSKTDPVLEEAAENGGAGLHPAGRRGDLLRRDQPGGGDENGRGVGPMLRGFLFDLDGTVYRGEKLIPGADTVIRLLRETGRRVVFLSNKPLETRENYAGKLTRLGIPTTPEEVINSSFVMTRYLLKHAPGARLFVVGETPFLEELKRAGFVMSDEPEKIEWVIASFDRTFDYRKLNVAFQAIKRGARFIATNPDRTCPVEEGEIPDCAGIIAALEAVTQKKVEAIVGKPSPLTVEAALEVMGLPASECILIGDRLETDIRMGKESGMATGLVLTGVTDEAALLASPTKPDYVFASIADLPRILE